MQCWLAYLGLFQFLTLCGHAANFGGLCGSNNNKNNKKHKNKNKNRTGIGCTSVMFAAMFFLFCLRLHLLFLCLGWKFEGSRSKVWRFDTFLLPPGYCPQAVAFLPQLCSGFLCLRFEACPLCILYNIYIYIYIIYIYIYIYNIICIELYRYQVI